MAIQKIRIKSTARSTGNGHIRVRTTVSNGSKTRTTSKTFRVK